MRSVKQILDSKQQRIIKLAPDASVLEMVQTMADHAIGSVLVMQGEALLGIATERDYARKVILQRRSSAETPISAIMSAPVMTIAPDQRANMCMQLMTEKRIRHLPVVEDEQVIGVLSIGDLLKVVIAEQQQEIEALQQYIAG